MKLFVACVFVLLLSPKLAPSVIPENMPMLAPETVAYAHAYHGIKVSMQGVARGNRFFERDGKTCRLFTKGFLEWYPKEKERRQQQHLRAELKRLRRQSTWQKD